MLTKEWKRRIDNWRRELPNNTYRPLGVLALNGFITKDQITVEQAMEHELEPMPVGTKWGAKWEYAWFKGQVALPESAQGARCVLMIDVGAESAIYVNGVAVGASGRRWRRMTPQQEMMFYHDAIGPAIVVVG